MRSPLSVQGYGERHKHSAEDDESEFSIESERMTLLLNLSSIPIHIHPYL